MPATCACWPMPGCSMAARPWAEWVRTYRSHTRGGDPWADPGHQDVTVEVEAEQLLRVTVADGDFATRVLGG